MLLTAQMTFSWTPAKFYYGRLWMTEPLRTYFQFGLMTCNDGFVALANENADVGLSYELVIGRYLCFLCNDN